MLKYIIQSILFLSGKELNINELSKHFGISEGEILDILTELKNEIENSGINIKIFDNATVQLVTNPYYGEDVSKYFNPDAKPKKLTKAAMETLSIIAYNQPITKSEVEFIRGVSIEKVLQTLEEKNLIYVCGKKTAIGTPNLYATTEDFLSYLCIKNLEELPRYDEVKDIVKNPVE